MGRGERSDVPNVVVVFTAGRSTIQALDVGNQAAYLRNAGTAVYVVGIGRAIDEGELAQIPAQRTDLVLVSRLQDLNQQLDTLVQKSCPPIWRTTYRSTYQRNPSLYLDRQQTDLPHQVDEKGS